MLQMLLQATCCLTVIWAIPVACVSSRSPLMALKQSDKDRTKCSFCTWAKGSIAAAVVAGWDV